MARYIRGKKKDNNNKIIAIFVVLMLVISLGIGFAAFFLNAKEKPTPPVKPNDISDSISSSNDSSISQTESSKEQSKDNPSEEIISSQSSEENSEVSSSSEDISEASPLDKSDVNIPEFNEPPIQTDVKYNIPNNMRAIFITAGVDYLKNPNDSVETIQKDIDEAFKQAEKLGMNSFIFNVTAHNKAIFKNSLFGNLTEDFDPLSYALKKAKEMDAFTYAVYDTKAILSDEKIVSSDIINSNTIDFVTENLKLLCENYHFDGIILDNYTNDDKDSNYNEYLKYGGGMGYENYIYSLSKILFDSCSETILRYSPGTQIGMMTLPVWKNQSETDADGSLTNSDYTTYYDGNCDSLDIMKESAAHFIMVNAYGSTTDRNVNFENVVKWWSQQIKDTSMQYYILHSSSKMATQNPGWTEYDQIIKQVMTCEKLDNFSGSAFNSLSRMVEDPKNSTTNLIKYYNNEINPNHILKELAVTSPKKLQFETFEKTMTFQGASDPNTEVTINGQKIQTDQNGYFSVNFDLKPGDNLFQIVHKGRQVNYKIYRRVVIIKEFSPTGNLTVDGNTEIAITALAYADAKITATLGGQTVALNITNSQTDEPLGSDYKLFAGTLKVPAAKKAEQKLGNIVFNGDWQGMKESKTAANVTINKLLDIANGQPVEIIARSAETFPTNVLNDTSDPNYYPLPKGAKDYVVGNEMHYTAMVKGKPKTYTYYKLASNVRVYKDDIRAIPDEEAPTNNKINGISVSSDKNYTYVSVDTKQSVSYSAKYTGSAFTIKFNYTTSMPSSVQLGANPLFSSATASGQTLTLNLNKQGSFLGYFAYYKNGKLIFRFNNPPRISGGSLKDVRIVIDSGHGGIDQGASGFLPAYPESVVVRNISLKLYNKLAARGAAVKLIYTTSGELSLQRRMEVAREFNPHILISIHANSTSSNSSVTGTEAYYFNSYSKNLAAYVSANVSQALGTQNRGAKFAYMYVTRDSQFASTLLETGFLSNQAEYKKLITDSYQDKIADAVINGISSYLKGVYTSGSYGSGLDDSFEDSFDSSETENNDTGKNIPLNSFEFAENEITITKGDKHKLELRFDPENASNKKIIWESDAPDTVRVLDDGTIVALRTGDALIYATSEETGEYQECYVLVVDEKE